MNLNIFKLVISGNVFQLFLYSIDWLALYICTYIFNFKKYSCVEQRKKFISVLQSCYYKELRWEVPPR